MTDWLKRNLFFIILGFFIIGFLFISREKEETNHNEITPVDMVSNKTEDESSADERMLVDIKGEINTPGVYELDSGSRVNDVIKMADGFTDDADKTSINLAQKVHDEMIIIVPIENDEIDETINQTASSTEQNEKVKINYATQEEIETLPGIGPSKAQTIIKYREENGLFQTMEDLLDISGIGEKTLENMEDNIQIP